MRYEDASYVIAVLCFISAALLFAALLFMAYAQHIEFTAGGRLMYLVPVMLLWMLGLIFAILSHVTRTREIKPGPLPSRIPSPSPGPTEAKPTKKTRKVKWPQIRLTLNLPNIVSLSLLSAGVVALTAALLFASSVLAFVGLGLTFWGATFLYVKTEKPVKEALLDTTTFPSLLTLYQLIAELGFKGQAVYLPPAYLTDSKSSKVFVPKHEQKNLLNLEQLPKDEGRLFTTSPEGVLLTPSGADLARLFETTLGTPFTQVKLSYLKAHLPRLIIEDLEIADNFTMEIRNDTVSVHIESSTYRKMHLAAQKHVAVTASMECPLCSAIACAIAKAANMPVVVDSEQTSEDGQTMTIEYHLLKTGTGMP